MNLKKYEIWLATGSQDLYGEATLKKVAEHSKEIAKYFDDKIVFEIVYKPVLKSTDEISNLCKDANASKNCIGIIAWMHTFSPSKMWISGLNILQKPLLHLHTQYNRDIPFADIDMDFMNLNQSAHGDREFAHILSKMRKPHKTVVGYWQNLNVISKIETWGRAALGKHEMNGLKVARFGDNMRYVAVTDGDKVMAEMKLGLSVNTYAVGDLVKVIENVDKTDIEKRVHIYEEKYTVDSSLLSGGQKRASMLEAAKIELGIEKFLIDGGFGAYTNTFEDLHGMKQLPGIGSQRMMAAGYGYGGEGDWKTSAMVRVMKTMATGMAGGNSFMEDYTYHFDPENQMVLGSHMLEICPSIAEKEVSCEIHELGIGGKEAPVRLVFNAAEGPAINVSLVDVGGRFRMIVQEVNGLKITEKFPKLPTARALWQTMPDMEIGLEAWLLVGGAHHTVYSQNLTVNHIQDLAEMLDIELIIIDKNTDIRTLKSELRNNNYTYS